MENIKSLLMLCSDNVSQKYEMYLFCEPFCQNISRTTNKLPSCISRKKSLSLLRAEKQINLQRGPKVGAFGAIGNHELTTVSSQSYVLFINFMFKE